MLKKILLISVGLVAAVVLAKQLFFTESTKPIDRAWAVIDGVNFVGMSVSDLDASTKLYQEAADLKPVGDDVHAELAVALGVDPITEIKSRMMRSVNSQMLFMQIDTEGNRARAAVPVNGPGIGHVCYQVNSETRAYQTFLEQGATTIGNPEMVQLNPKNPVQYAYAKDRDGVIFEVEHVDVAALKLPEPPKNEYRIRQVALSTPDMDRIVKFYSILLEEPNPRRLGRFFGFSGEKIDQVSGLENSKLKMSWFQVRNLELEIVQYVSHPTKVPSEPRALSALGYNMIVFDVKDLTKARALFERAGGKIIREPSPMMGGEILFGRDPDGNLIGLQKTDANRLVSSKNFSDNGI